MRKHLMKNIKYDNFDESNYICDSGPEEPNLCTLTGYDSCEDCYFRLSTIERLTPRVQTLKEVP